MRLVILPQAIRLVVPSLVTQLVAIVKDSTLGLRGVSYPELMKQANNLANNTKLLLQAFVVVSADLRGDQLRPDPARGGLETRIGRAGSGRGVRSRGGGTGRAAVGGRPSLTGDLPHPLDARAHALRCRPKNDSIRPQAWAAASGSGPTWAIFISGRASSRSDRGVVEERVARGPVDLQVVVDPLALSAAASRGTAALIRSLRAVAADDGARAAQHLVDVLGDHPVVHRGGVEAVARRPRARSRRPCRTRSPRPCRCSRAARPPSDRALRDHLERPTLPRGQRLERPFDAAEPRALAEQVGRDHQVAGRGEPVGLAAEHVVDARTPRAASPRPATAGRRPVG